MTPVPLLYQQTFAYSYMVKIKPLKQVHTTITSSESSGAVHEYRSCKHCIYISYSIQSKSWHKL